jgi:MFS family permease
MQELRTTSRRDHGRVRRLSQLQWITNAYLLTLGVTLILAGKLGDRYGRRLMFLVGVVGFGLASGGSA